ncbi:MAG TPA: acetate--CoA ligase family protein, partial [Gaiellaceae bacterium]|nr:acetate--CoA ligase family protein [Gaiellaceae bacterium]
GILCADACDAAGLTVPRLSEQTVAGLRAFMPEAASDANPVDLLGSATAADYERAVPLLLADPQIDALIVLFVPPVSAGVAEVADALERAVAGSTKPVLAALVAHEKIEQRTAFVDFMYPESAARALGRAAERADWLRRPEGTVPTLDRVDRAAAEAIVARPDGWLEPDEVRRLLVAYGIPVVEQRDAATVDEAIAGARELGFPVVVKSATAGAHKTETGGIALDLRDEDAVAAAVASIGAPVILQPMLRGGAELLAGVFQDPVFGPIVAFGAGGVLAELIGEATFRIAPITDVDADELVTSGKAGRLVAGFRGAPPADADALRDLLLRLSRLAEDLPEVAELDLNPVIATPAGCVAVDARIRIARPSAATGPKTW